MSVTVVACASSSAPTSTAAGVASAAPAASASSSPSSVSTPAATSSATSARSAAAVQARAVQSAGAAVAALIASQPADAVSVAALNVSTGATFAAGATSGMWTASDYKLFVLETLLLNEQDSGGLTQSQQAEAVPMIEESDNAAGYDLFLAAGGSAALTAAAATFGMTNTVVGRTDPTFTTTSGSDYLKLLGNLVDADSPLNAASRAYILNLMTHVESDQRWGVGVVADAGSAFANKNGWLSIDNSNGAGEDDDGLWAVNSVGVVTVDGQQLLLAVFTRHQTSMDAGVSLVQALTSALTPTVA